MKQIAPFLTVFIAGAAAGAAIAFFLADKYGPSANISARLAEGARKKIAEISEKLKGSNDLEHRNRQEFYDEAFSEGGFPGS